MMKKIIEHFFVLLVCVVCTGSMKAQSQHWQCNPYDWQYDMTAYITFSLNNKIVDNMANYEIAAFCGDECRGVTTMQVLEKDGQTTTYGYLRIRSNQQTGETITFKVYDSVIGRELETDNAIEFVSNSVVGFPSKPYVITQCLRGDLDNDGVVNGTDIQAVINLIVDGEYDERADLNEDNVVNGTDIQEIINIIVGIE